MSVSSTLSQMAQGQDAQIGGCPARIWHPTEICFGCAQGPPTYPLAWFFHWKCLIIQVENLHSLQEYGSIYRSRACSTFSKAKYLQAAQLEVLRPRAQSSWVIKFIGGQCRLINEGKLNSRSDSFRLVLSARLANMHVGLLLLEQTALCPRLNQGLLRRGPRRRSQEPFLLMLCP